MIMWWKMAVGAVVGFAVGSFAPPGHALWVTAGVLAGWGADVLVRRRARRSEGG